MFTRSSNTLNRCRCQGNAKSTNDVIKPTPIPSSGDVDGPALDMLDKILPAVLPKSKHATFA